MAVSLRSLVGAPAQTVQRVELEGDYVCWRFKWLKPFPQGVTIYGGYSMVYVDSNGYVYAGGLGDSVFYVWIYDVDGNPVGSYTFTVDFNTLRNFIWAGITDADWGHSFSTQAASSASYLVASTLSPSEIYVFRYGKKIWQWNLKYDNIQKRIYGIAISPNAKYIAFTVASDTYCDSVALYEGISDSSLCPKPPS